MTTFHTYAGLHPADSTPAAPVEASRAGITEPEWLRLRRAARLAVIEALFDELAEQDECEWAQGMGCALSECKRMAPRPPFDEAWSMAISLSEPPASWLPRNTRERDALRSRNYLPRLNVQRGEEGALSFLYRALKEAYEA